MKFHYNMQLDFDHPVIEHHFTLKCIPRSSFRQGVGGCHVQIDPVQKLWKGSDQFGNIMLMGYLPYAHDHLYAEVCGEADIRFGKEDAHGPLEILSYPSALTQAGPAIKSLLEEAENQSGQFRTERKVRSEEADRSENLALTLALMNLIYQKMTYSPGETDIETCAEQAAESGHGVCQDYAQIMLAALRLRKIPCRYVCGMLTGVGESHAWVEAYDQGAWIGYDPTNNILAGDQHLVIAYGRDAGDCRISQGVFLSQTGVPISQKQKIRVSVSI